MGRNSRDNTYDPDCTRCPVCHEISLNRTSFRSPSVTAIRCQNPDCGAVFDPQGKYFGKMPSDRQTMMAGRMGEMG